MELDTEVVLQILTAFLAAYFGAYLALNRFKKERQWQERYSAYIEIVNAISDLMVWATETYSRCKLLPSLDPGKHQDFYSGYENARLCLRRYSQSGKLVISSDVIAELEQLDTQLWSLEFDFENSAGDPQEYENLLSSHTKDVRDIADEFLKKIIPLAKKDLG